MARDTGSARFFPGDFARFLSIGVLGVYVLVVISAFLLRGTPLPGNPLSSTTLLAASGLSAMVCLAAWQISPRKANLPWLVFGLGALFAAITHGFGLISHGATAARLLEISWAGGAVLFSAGLAVMIQRAERGGWLELGIDVALVGVAAAVVVLRWAPGAGSTSILGIVAPVAALCAALFMVVLLAAPNGILSRASAFALGAATLSLVLAVWPQVIGGSPCCHAKRATMLAAAGSWVFLMFAGAAVFRAEKTGVIAPQGERLRQYVAPVVAIVLAAISIDTSLHPVERRTAIALAVLAVLVALRLMQLLQATRMQQVERRELIQMRALMDVNRALAGADDLDATLRTVTDWAQRVLNAKAAAIELLSDQKQLVLRAATGLPQDVIGLTFPVDSSFTGWVVKTGDPRVAENASNDPFVSPESSAILGDAPVAAVPLRFRERTLGVLLCVGSRPFDSNDLELLRAFANQAAVAIEDASLFEQVRTMAITDPLTGLANRRRFDRELEREFAAARRGRRLVAVMFDLDDFKQHNDRYGHLAGDRALKHFAEALLGSTRAMNLAARFGGDEFFALLADNSLSGAQVFIGRVQARFAESMRDAGNAPLTVSAGIAEFKPDMQNAAELIEAADRALYISKSERGTSK
jgi:diguanylate cyclase (GGDEF)-like protein